MKYKQKIILIIYGILIGLIMAGLIWIIASPPRGTSLVISDLGEANITIYITGEILNPGTYDLLQGSRIGDAIDAAGGFDADADRESINLAKLIQDGEHIVVLKKGDSNNYNIELVNINSASRESLETLPGIGEVAAFNIIAYRQEYGNFISIEEIQKVVGIGPSIYEGIKNLITVGN